MLSVSYASKNAYSAGKTSGVLMGDALGAKLPAVNLGFLRYVFVNPLLFDYQNVGKIVKLIDSSRLWVWARGGGL